ncbi:MAG: UDP-N-acetylmuramoyl-tripeptide--D-alanyl-D-alanine ligase [candidate division KSB1 bacterium]|nr:UDP-N-acetylmuramoyl-tripeptide--D-alanyl-D-alanine ligase [candidate division KSB1 bacterium]MDZ7272451.1 UDP-N-acetylmuramoyl-tripeptide--D-alanyl-D-alanine ligase [candidate division KSB1 bacterium]MDZ7284525.1 UDP-N-acetylmuramoyl-tripeptide--D-alanyl-D-alanine ligase [candidate division KSB1 bacterium]MDZ7297079.1 UDP-N-acetylmuramoyl-tripeptide--D-alanyl-D-alanine ligase [candidate division KSB1 bacterium]MDZ7308158.1 UDP-N-acetylmuramoyl-tripeptide--D-alanyl-D-alanine ligase [candidat
MPILFTLGEVLQAFEEAATYVGEASRLATRPAALSTDSRTCGVNELFFALQGDKFDGHDFLPEVFQRQALAAVVAKTWHRRHPRRKGNFIVVDDPLLALQRLGRNIRRRWGRPVIALTGSNGKTTTKELLAALLSRRHLVHKTSGNLNNHIGVPLTLSQLTHAHELAVIEMGANHFHEIARLCELAAPNYGLITNIGRAHVEFFGDLAGVARAKTELFAYLQKRDGIAFLNADEARLVTVHPSGLKTVTFGLHQPAQVHGTIKAVDREGHVTLTWRGLDIRLPVPGVHNASNALAAIAVADFFGLDSATIKAGIESFTGVARRMQILQIAGMIVINDAYNANPESMKAALEFLAQYPRPEHGRRVAILGDMLEMGASAEAVHRELGEFIATLPIQAVFAYGPQMRHLVHAIGQHCWALHFEDKNDLMYEVSRSVRAGDILLLKGSRGMAMEQVLEKLPAPA